MDSSVRISSASVSDRGLSDKRPQNEDSYLEMGQCGIYAVADGVGGAQAGEVASQMAMEILGEAFANLQDSGDAENAMRTSIERANTAIYQMAHDLPQLSSMATTVVALHLAGNIATIGHVGDSRLYRVDRDGNLFRETEDHSMVAEEVRAGRMTEEQAENHPSRSIISRALGAETTVNIDLKTMMIEPGTAFLICSDGITRHVNDQEIKGVLTFGGDPTEICEYLKALCYERGAEDNLTAVVVKTAAAAGAANSSSPLELADLEEQTIATARPAFEAGASDDDDELLELENHKLSKPKIELELPEEPESDEKTIPIYSEDDSEFASQPEADIPTLPGAEPESSSDEEVEIPQVAEPPQAARVESYSTYDTGTTDPEVEKPGLLVRIASAGAWILLGGVIGMWVYHFAFEQKPPEMNDLPLSEMKTANIPLSAFEENRRNVDKDPAGYIGRFGTDPQDSEDFYLLGRAYLLTGDYAKAKIAFTGARDRLSGADPVNAKILASDIAIALAVTNDTTVQTNLKKELDDANKQPANAAANPVNASSNGAPSR